MNTPVELSLIHLALLGLIVGLAMAMMGLERWLARRDRLRRRLANAARVGPHVSAGEETALFIAREARQALNKIVMGVGGLSLIGQGDRDKVQALLVRAGWRQREALGTYSTIKMAGSLTGLLLGLGAVILLDVQAGNALGQFMVVFVALFVGGQVPEVAVKRIAARRQLQIKTHLADAVDLMIIAANAGQSLDVSLGRVAEEMERHAPALGDELQVTLSELRGLPDRRQPLENLARRTELKEVRSVTATLVQTLRYGTPLAQSLKVLAREMREARMLAIEERAARLPAILSLPLMLFIMPAVFVVTAGPGILAIGEAFSR